MLQNTDNRSAVLTKAIDARSYSITQMWLHALMTFSAWVEIIVLEIKILNSIDLCLLPRPTQIAYCLELKKF